MVARRAPDPSLTVLRLDRRIWPNGPPRGDLPRADSPVAMLCQGQTCSLPVATPEALAALLGRARDGTFLTRAPRESRRPAVRSGAVPFNRGGSGVSYYFLSVRLSCRVRASGGG